MLLNFKKSALQILNKNFYVIRKSGSAKYFFYGGLILGGYIINNYEEFFTAIHLNDSFIKKGLDKFFDKQPLEQDVTINIYKEKSIEVEDLLNKSPEDILQLNLTNFTPSTKASTQDKPPLPSAKAISEKEDQLLNEININKQQINLQLLDLETKLMDFYKNRVNILTEIKKELENQKVILDSIYSKIKHNQNEKAQWEELKTDILNSLKLVYLDLENFEKMPAENQILIKELKDRNNIKKVTKDKELEIMRTFMANYNTEIIFSHERLEKLKSSFEKLTQEIRKRFDEIKEKEELIENLRNVELNYLNKKNSFTEKLYVSSFTNPEDQSNAKINSNNIIYDPIRLSENNKQMINVIQYLYDRIRNTNNQNNLVLFNKTIQFFNKKMFEISYIFQDKFVMDLLSRGKIISKRLYSHVEIENEFQLIKRDLFYNIFKNEYSKGQESILVDFSGKFLSKGTELILRFYRPSSINETKDSNFIQKLKALYFLNFYIKKRDYPNAFRTLSYFRDNTELNKKLLALNTKLINMTQEIYAIDLMKNHLN